LYTLSRVIYIPCIEHLADLPSANNCITHWCVTWAPSRQCAVSNWTRLDWPLTTVCGPQTNAGPFLCGLLLLHREATYTAYHKQKSCTVPASRQYCSKHYTVTFDKISILIFSDLMSINLCVSTGCHEVMSRGLTSHSTLYTCTPYITWFNVPLDTVFYVVIVFCAAFVRNKLLISPPSRACVQELWNQGCTSNVPQCITIIIYRCCRQAASQVSHTATDGGSTTSAIHCWTPSFRCARPHGLELPAGWPPRTAGLWVL